MTFEKKHFKTTYTRHQRNNIKTKIRSLIPSGQILKSTLIFSTIAFLILTAIIYQKYIRPLPSIKELENMDIAESSTIYDKDGNELYKVYKEKRTYIPYEGISQNMVHAIVAGEDKTFFQNGGVDFKRMLGAFVYFAIGKTDKVQGTSTISQQLIRNTVIANERSLERKIKEMYLSYKLNRGVSKQKILELYLNKIEYGSNAYGIEQAAKTFFGKKASDLSPLESSILASLPKGPSYYSPYNHPDRLLGYTYITNGLNIEDATKIITPKDVIDNNVPLKRFTDELQKIEGRSIDANTIVLCGLTQGYYKANISIDANGCSTQRYEKLLEFLNSIHIQEGEEFIEYQTGRKDFILQRMLEDGYIDFAEYKKSLLSSIGYKFNTYNERIKYPHFVFYVKEYVESKYGKDILEQGGLKIYTTIDSKLQDKAESLINSYGNANEKRINADNAALISIDNRTGHIIAMVGGRDYFKEGKGNVNIITSKLQPGSSFKPFVYALAIDSKRIGSKSPIYDVKTFFPGYGYPKDFDGRFMGRMNITTALDNSRNIPAVKMYYLAGGEKKIVDFVKTLGMNSVQDNASYGAPMALGTAEIAPLELASAYSVFANLGYKKNVTPILKIVDSKGLIVEETREQIGEKVMSEATAYIMNTILSDTNGRPDTWNKYLTLRDRSVAAKTGTSTKQYNKKNGEKVVLPRNLWTAGYTPQYTTVVWVGNTNGKEVSMNGDGLMSAGPIWRDFMNYAHTGEKVLNWKMPSTVKSVAISAITGKIASGDSDGKMVVQSLFKNAPGEYDSSLKLVKVDALCNGKISDKTPASAIKEVYLIDFNNIDTETKDWQGGIREWLTTIGKDESIIGEGNYITSMKTEECDRSNIVTNIDISSSIKSGAILSDGDNYLEVYYNSVNPVKSIEVYLGDNKILTQGIDNQKEGTFKGTISIPSGYYDAYNLTVRVIDNAYYSADKVSAVTISQKDTSAPTIDITSPVTNSIKQQDIFQLKASIDDNAPLKSVNIYLDGTPIKIGIEGRVVDFTINANKDLTIGKHLIKVEAIDTRFNSAVKEISLEVTE